jgi:SPP1 gp7 family putative phage head morphogenesis protein
MKPENQRAEQSYYEEILGIFKEFVFGKQINNEEFLEQYAAQAAYRMVVGRLQSTARSWRQAAHQNMQGAVIYAALQNELKGPVGVRVRELIQQNSLLIRSLPREVASRAAAHIASQAQEGKRATASIPGLLAHVARYRARLIARTETSKATTALTQARSEELGLEWYMWRTSKDARVRLSHRKMDTVLFRWNDPPSPEKLVGEHSTLGKYNAGNAPNCRCYPEPLLRLNQVVWPHRVFYGGVIRPMTLGSFRQLNHLSTSELGIAA